jgi:hypothetical protein
MENILSFTLKGAAKNKQENQEEGKALCILHYDLWHFFRR